MGRFYNFLRGLAIHVGQTYLERDFERIADDLCLTGVHNFVEVDPSGRKPWFTPRVSFEREWVYSCPRIGSSLRPNYHTRDETTVNLSYSLMANSCDA